MTQQLKIKITENGITRDATPGEVAAWSLLQFFEACQNDALCCDQCPLQMEDDGIVKDTDCWTNTCGANKSLKNKEVTLEVIEV